jgi:hypothetical protein
MAQKLTRGTGQVELGVVDANGPLEITVERVPLSQFDLPRLLANDLPGPAFQMLAEDVAYLKLSNVAASEIGDYVERARGAAVWVIDIRNYPSAFVVFSLGGHLVDAPAVSRESPAPADRGIVAPPRPPAGARSHSREE